MKKTLKKFVFILIMILLCTFGTISFANENVEFKFVEKSENFKRWENLPEEQRKNTIMPSYFDISFNNSVKRSVYNNLLKSAMLGDVAETKYDPRENGKTFIVKNQQKTGSCWAFSFSSVLEAVSKKNKEYSPMHMDYMTEKMFTRKIGAGGNFYLGLAYSNSGKGPVYESDLPFDSVYDESGNSLSTYYLKKPEEVTLDQEPKAIVKDATIFAKIYKNKKEDGTLTYSADAEGKSVYSTQEVEAIRQVIKNKIKENGAITAQMYMEAVTGYNAENKSYYCDGYADKKANHAVTIVGWDDNFSKTKFTPNAINDGAYIVLNSYGTEYGDQGFVYVSYDDARIEEDLLTVNSMEEFEVDESGKPEPTYDNLYQYDELGMNYALALTDSSTKEPLGVVYAGNVYERKDTTKTELLSEVGISTLVTTGVEVYVVNADNGLPSVNNLGSPIISRTGANALEAGYHTVKLSSPIELTGNKFAVIVKYINEEGANFTFECNLKETGLTYMSSPFDKSTSNSGESFVYLNNVWNDLYNLKMDFLHTLKGANLCIKAFTTVLKEGEIVNVTGVSLDKTTFSMAEEEEITLVATITPTYATNKKVTWSSSNEEVATVSDTGMIKALKEGSTVITVTTEDGEFTATCNLTVTKKVNKDDDIYKDDPNKDDSDGKEKPSDEENGDGDNKKPSDEGNSGNGSGSGSASTSEKGKDNTTAKGSLPFTGIKVITIVIVVIGAIGIVMYKKYENLKEIK